MSSAKLHEQEKTTTVKPARTREYLPEVDIYKSEKNIFLEANLPGVDENSLEISLEKNILTIAGTNNSSVPDGVELKYSEYTTGNYRRSFELNMQVDGDRIEAVMKNGVLRVTLPIREPLIKRIPVKAD